MRKQEKLCLPKRLFYGTAFGRLSFQSRNSAAKDDGYSTVSQSVVLFIAPEVEIPSGSKITVTQNGKTTDYCRSGESAVYTSHQEIALELFEDYA